MSGFDMEWATKHQRKTGREVKVQAGAGALAPKVDTAAYQAHADALEQADPFAPAPEPPTQSDQMMVLVLDYPLSGNRYWGERIIPAANGNPAFTSTFRTKEADAYIADCQKRALIQGVRKPFKGRVFVGIELYPHRPQDWLKRMTRDPLNWDDDVRCVDLDNARKVLLDALQGIAYENDKWIWKDAGERKEPDAHGGRVVVTVQPIVRVDPRGSLF